MDTLGIQADALGFLAIPVLCTLAVLRLDRVAAAPAAAILLLLISSAVQLPAWPPARAIHATEDSHRLKVFVVGLSRTGTSSITVALEHLGWSVAHYPVVASPDFVAHFADGISDLPAVCALESLAQQYPDAVFIETRRERRDWAVATAEFLWKNRRQFALPMVSSCFEEVYPKWRSKLGNVTALRKLLLVHYDQHKARLNALRMSKLRIHLHHFSVFEGEGWSKLCHVLGVEMAACPDAVVPFPHVDHETLHMYLIPRMMVARYWAWVRYYFLATRTGLLGL